LFIFIKCMIGRGNFGASGYRRQKKTVFPAHHAAGVNGALTDWRVFSRHCPSPDRVYESHEPGVGERRLLQEIPNMKKILTAMVAVATVAGSLSMTAPAAKARDGVGVGIAAGLLGGAIIGGAIASSRPAYADPAYVAGPPGPPPGGCYWRRERYWDGYGYVVHPVRVCY
jgi:hypothetical protein